MREKILSRLQLTEQLDALRRERPDLKMVFTNGCFDLLHVGHVAYLWEARKQGDGLIVALNDDDSIRRLKGDDRPVLALDERLQVVAGLACVDYVTWFDEDTPIPLLRQLRPEVLVKGANYTVEGVVGHDVVTEWDAEVMTLALSPGRSSSNLIERVRALG